MTTTGGGYSSNTALYISVASAAITATGLTWQLFLYRLAGARLLVELLPTVIDQNGSVYWRRAGRWLDFETVSKGSTQGHTIELAHIRVTNVGRIATSVSDIQLDFGRIGSGLPWYRRGGKGFPLTILDATADDVVRLEPGQFASVMFPALPVALGGLFDSGAKRLYIRGTARAAGRRRQKLSSWRRRWKISEGQLGMYAGAPVDGRRLAYRALWANVHRGNLDRTAINAAWWAIEPLLEADYATVASELESKLGRDIVPAGTTMDVLQAFRRAPTVGPDRLAEEGTDPKPGQLGRAAPEVPDAGSLTSDHQRDPGESDLASPQVQEVIDGEVKVDAERPDGLA